ncbi:DUF6046 domain-containing protein [Mucilaginibacter sp. Mucisp84]|uniref:DUF6046 domain-containing protein n=1 Tax=Mucilaginibacter sp. Mucisp84 TaxID=3243058 RepID=UPI0039A4644A
MEIGAATNIAKGAGYATGNQLLINLPDVFKTIYGYLPQTVPGLPVSDDSNPFSVGTTSTEKRTTLKGSPLYGLSDVLGREVFCPVTINVAGKDYGFPYAVLGLRSRKILKETPMTERGGRVIEQIGVDAWEIILKGFFLHPLNQFPDEELDMLNQVYKYNEPVKLKCALSDLFLDTDDRVVIASLDIPEKAKIIGVKDFAFTMIQNTILDLTKVD